MIRMTVQEMVDATGATLVAGNAQTVFCGVCIDSRIATDGAAFVAGSSGRGAATGTGPRQ